VSRLCAAVALLASFLAVTAASQHTKKNEESKSQVLPLPPELPMALVADTAALDFHMSSLLRTGGLSAQIRQSLNDLIRDTHGETIIKLRAFVAGAGDARRVAAQAAEIFTERKLPLPVLSIVQVGGLGIGAAQVTIEATVATHRTLNPNGLAFIAGQSGADLPSALHSLRQSVQAAEVAPENVLTSTCFTSRIEDDDATRASIRAIFPKAGINVVQALRDPATDRSSCEAIGQLTRPPTQGPLVRLEKTRAAQVNTPQLIFTGLQLSFGNFLDDANVAFTRLERAASAIRPLETPVEVNVFSLDPSAGSALRKTSPVPLSIFTIQLVEGLPSVDASAGIEAVLAPDVASSAIALQ
jgi:enamine deaminase RidA (YjgF/YER057c/UK114 family)